jgi:uncharacterized iron-regulated membrane protein
MKLRTVFFWIHLAVGLTIGLVFVNMSVTGMIMAFEPQIVAFAERDVRRATPPAPDAKPMPLGALVARVREQVPKASLSTATFHSDPTASALLNLGRDAGSVYVNPYTGEVLGKGSKTHDFMHGVEAWHRRLSLAPARPAEGGEPERRPIGRTLTGVSAIGVFLLALSGVYLWWPRTWAAARSVILFRGGPAGRARDFNWHNVAGFWCAALLVISTTTGLVMSFRWANDLVYRLAGSAPPAPRAGEGRAEARGEESSSRPDLDALWTRATSQVPGWVSIGLRFPRRGDAVTASIVEPGHAHPNPRSMLTLDAATGTVVKWEPFSQQNAGRRLRAWVKPIHTGEAFGIFGQLLAFTAAAGATLLIWTGFALSLHRFRAWRKRRASQPSAAPVAPALEPVDSLSP